MSDDNPFDRVAQRWSRRIDMLLALQMAVAAQQVRNTTPPEQRVALQYDRPREAQWKREQRNRGKR